MLTKISLGLLYLGITISCFAAFVSCCSSFFSAHVESRRARKRSTEGHIPCPVRDCSMRFTNGSNLRRHQRVKHGPIEQKSLSFKCSFCNQRRNGTRGQENIRIHMMRKHREELRSH
ncbi:hypothetical protein AA313_de0204887 [Arthrobotrys entomopaga]|nr:hypothetical protein AA313_de0204887 [Arthrobotrys entomopaga]